MRKLLCLLAGAALLAGCATTRMSDERYGYVHKIYASGVTPSGLPECLARLTSEQLDSGRFVEIKYGTMKLRKYLIAYASKEMPLSEHDKVIFNPSTCVGTEFPRIKPALPTDLMPPFKGQSNRLG